MFYLPSEMFVIAVISFVTYITPIFITAIFGQQCALIELAMLQPLLLQTAPPANNRSEK